MPVMGGGSDDEQPDEPGDGQPTSGPSDPPDPPDPDATLAQLGREIDGTARRYTDQLRARRALELKVSGLYWWEVAEHPDCHYHDAGTAQRAVKRLLAEMPAHDAAEYRREGIARYERLLRAVWPAAIGENPDGSPRAKGPSYMANERAQNLVDRIVELSGAKHAPLEDTAVEGGEVDPDAIGPGAGRTLAELMGASPEQAARFARFLHNEGLLPASGRGVVIEHREGDAAGGET